MKIMVAGGGTAGHISPALAVVAALARKHPDIEVLFICSGKPMETALLQQHGIEYKTISAGKYRRYGRGKWKELSDIPTQLQNLKDAGKVLKGYTQARKIIRSFRPDVVFIKGGYVGVPVGVAAARAHVPVVVHESDVVMGGANKFLVKYATKIAVSFPVEAYTEADQGKLVFTGNPVREDFIKSSQLKPLRSTIQKPNVFLFAGSQGAADLNRLVFENIEMLVKHNNLLHVTGEQGIEQARIVRHRLGREMQANYEIHSFLKSEMVAAYEWADIVVARAGMNTLCEIAAVAKPAIIIPLPSSTNNHQLKNAQFLSRAGAIRLLPQKDITGLRLINEIAQLADDSSARNYLQKTIHKFFVPNASEHIAQLISSQLKDQT